MARCKGSCEGQLGNQGDWVICGQCKCTYCYTCAGVKQTTWYRMIEGKRAEWKCKQRCRKSRLQSDKDEDMEGEKREDETSENDGANEETNEEDEQNCAEDKEIMKRMEKKMDYLIAKYDNQCKTMEELKETIEFISKEHKDLKKENSEIKEKLQQTEVRLAKLEGDNEKNAIIEKRMNTMYREAKEKEQYDRNRNLEINQLDWLQDENLHQVIGDLASNFNIQHSDSEIEAAHRIPNRDSNKPSTLIIQFKSRDYRDKWLKEKKRVVTNDSMYRNGNRKRIYLNENMTPYMKSLFWKTRMQAKEKNHDYVWFRNGKIMVRKNKDDNNVILIKEESDLLKLEVLQEIQQPGI